MSQRYSQSRALRAIIKASFTAIFNQPTALFFSLIFPIIFILIFGAFGSGGAPVYRITMAAGSDTSNALYDSLKHNKQFRIQYYADTMSREKDMAKGKLSAVVTLKEIKDSTGKTRYIISVNSTSANNDKIGGVMGLLKSTKLEYEYERLHQQEADKQETVIMGPLKVKEVRPYRQIDFVLPGQLGFSILFSTLFGIAFAFFGLREQLVLKRFYASPVKRINILIGIGMSRLFFQLMNVIILILFGHFLLNFTLQHGIITILEMLLMTVLMLFLLMGVGLIFSSIAKSDTSIPLLVNLFGFPQMMLSGTFFPIEVFPKWLQEICRILPLTQFNDAIRKISFEGLSIADCWREIGIMGIWMAIIYIIAAKVIKWE